MSTATKLLLAAWVTSAAWSSPGPSAQLMSRVLEQKLTSALSVQQRPLRMLLSEIDAHLSGSDFILFDFEICGEEPVVSASADSGTTVGAVLSETAKRTRQLKYRTAGERVIHVSTAGPCSIPSNPMDLRIRNFEHQQIDVFNFISRPWEWIPELREWMVSRDMSRGPSGRAGVVARSVGGVKIDVRLQNKSVREILNYVVEQGSMLGPSRTRFGWIYRYDPSATGPFQANRWEVFLNARTGAVPAAKAKK